MAAMAMYNLVKGDKRRVMGWGFYANTGYLCLPLSFLLLLSVPYTYLTDWTHRKNLDSIMHLWAQLTCVPFFRPEISFAQADGSLSRYQYNGSGVSLEDKVQPLLDGLPSLYRERGVVYVSNHQSWLDIYSLCWLGVPLKFISKKTIFYIPVVGWVMNVIGQIPLDRKDKNSGKNVMAICQSYLERGVPVTFFPEGTRTKTGELGAFKMGAFHLATNNQVAIVPITVSRTGKMMPPDEESVLDLSAGPAHIVVHEPILPVDSKGRRYSPDQLRELTKNAIQRGFVDP